MKELMPALGLDWETHRKAGYALMLQHRLLKVAEYLPAARYINWNREKFQEHIEQNDGKRLPQLIEATVVALPKAAFQLPFDPSPVAHLNWPKNNFDMPELDQLTELIPSIQAHYLFETPEELFSPEWTTALVLGFRPAWVPEHNYHGLLYRTFINLHLIVSGIAKNYGDPAPFFVMLRAIMAGKDQWKDFFAQYLGNEEVGKFARKTVEFFDAHR